MFVKQLHLEINDGLAQVIAQVGEDRGGAARVLVSQSFFFLLSIASVFKIDRNVKRSSP